MSITTGDFRSKITSSTLLDKKQKHEPITCLTAYDYPSARLLDEAGIDMILVGDSLGMVMLGYENTLPVTVEEMLHHTRAVRRGVKRGFLVVDMPFASYHVSGKETIRNAARFIKDGAEAVKIEGGEKRAATGRTSGGCGDPSRRTYWADSAITARAWVDTRCRARA